MLPISRRIRAARGFSLLEMAIATILVGVLATVLLNRLAYYEEAAEKAQVEATISILKSALRSRMASMMIEGRVQEYATLAGQNPIDWLERPPANYHGVHAGTAHQAIPPGSWYFDQENRELVYLVRNDRFFQRDSRGYSRIRLQVAIVGNLPESTDQPGQIHLEKSLRLRLQEPFYWQKYKVAWMK